MSLSVLSLSHPSLKISSFQAQPQVQVNKSVSKSTTASRNVVAKIKPATKITEVKTSYPTYPDVTLKKLPFYKIEDTLLKPSTLQSEQRGKSVQRNFTFYLSSNHLKRIADSKTKNSQGSPQYRQQVQVRFSVLDTTLDQKDNFPQSLSLKVNGKQCFIPNNPQIKPIPLSAKTVFPPIDITSLCKLNSTPSNTLTVSWTPVAGIAHTVSVYQVEKLTHKDLMEQLKKKGVRQPEYTKALIKEKLADEDLEISTTSCKVSLACPLGKMRMTSPCRPSTCDHLQCFDAQLYLQMNERSQRWSCPVCSKPALVEHLQIDGFFLDLVKSTRLPPDEHEVVLHNDGTWDPLDTNVEKERKQNNPSETKITEALVGSSKRPREDDTDCITLDGSFTFVPLKKAKLISESDIECIDID